MKPERGAALARAVLVSLEHWQSELQALRVEPGAEVAKRHLLSSLQQAHLSLRQMVARGAPPDSTET